MLKRGISFFCGDAEDHSGDGCALPEKKWCETQARTRTKELLDFYRSERP